MRIAPRTSVSGKLFSWQFMIVNGVWTGHGRAQRGQYSGAYNFNLYKWGLDNPQGINSAIAKGGIYAAGDIEEGNFGYSLGHADYSNQTVNVFTEAGGITFRWSMRSVESEGDTVAVDVFITGKARDDFNLQTASW